MPPEGQHAPASPALGRRASERASRDGVAVAPPPTPPPHAAAIRRRAAGGAAWTLGGYAAGSALRLGGNVILTHLLFPEVFGLMAIVNAIVLGLNLASDIGLGQGMVQHERGEEPEFVATAWTLLIVRRLMLGVACALLAGPVASFYGDVAADLRLILPMIGVTLIIEGFLSMRAYLARRWLTLGRLTALDLGTQGLAVVAMIAYAWVWPTVWALVVGSFVRTISWVVLSHFVLVGPRDRVGWDGPSARSLISFGKWIFVSTLLGFLAGQADRLFLGKLVPLDVLGVYGIAAALAVLPAEAFMKLASAVLFPVLSRLRADEPELRRQARSLRAPILLACGALVSALLAGGGVAVIELLYDHRYSQAGWMLQALAVGAWWRTLDAVHGATLLALGRTRALAVSNAVRAVGTFALAGAGWAIGGFAGAILGLVVADFVKYAATTLQVGHGSVRGAISSFADDAVPTLRVVGVSAAGAAAGHLALGGGAPTGVAGAVGGLVALACWAPAAWAWCQARRRPSPARSAEASA